MNAVEPHDPSAARAERLVTAEGQPREWPLVSIVVPVRNDAERLRACLASIRRAAYPSSRLEIVVVDNGSTDGSADVARAAGAQVVVLPGLRVGELRNRGARLARGEVLAFVDADHEIDALWIRRGVETLRLRGVAAVGATYSAPEGGTWVQRWYDALRARAAGLADVEWLPSGNMAVWRTPFESLGGFRSDLETCEDVEFCARLRAPGYRVVSDDRLRSVHFGDPPTLRALFLAELWRGRDSWRHRPPGRPSLRSLPSLVVPVVDLLALLVALIQVAGAPLGGPWLTAGAVGAIAGLAGGRALVMLRRRGPREGWVALPRAWAVALVYDIARALAPVVRTPHRRALPGWLAAGRR